MNKYHLNNDLCFSRFFKVSDPQVKTLFYDMIPEWWSRFYEYK